MPNKADPSEATFYLVSKDDKKAITQRVMTLDLKTKLNDALHRNSNNHYLWVTLEELSASGRTV